MNVSALFVLSQSPAMSDINMQVARMALSISSDTDVSFAFWHDAVYLLHHDHSSPFYNFSNQYKFLVESDVHLVVRISDLDQRGLEEYGTKFPVQFLTNEQFSAYINRYDKAFFL